MGRKAKFGNDADKPKKGPGKKFKKQSDPSFDKQVLGKFTFPSMHEFSHELFKNTNVVISR